MASTLRHCVSTSLLCSPSVRALQSVSLRTSALEPLDSEISRVCHCLLFAASYSVVFRVCQLWGCTSIRKAFTSAYHPQGDPVAEAFMKTLAASLSILTTQYPAEWDELCESTAFAYRT